MKYIIHRCKVAFNEEPRAVCAGAKVIGVEALKISFKQEKVDGRCQERFLW